MLRGLGAAGAGNVATLAVVDIGNRGAAHHALLGSYDGYTYPPGAGNLDSITYDTSSLQGTTPAVVNEVLRTGSTPFSGTFSVAFNGAKTEEMERQEATDEVEYVIEKLDTIGEIRVDRTDMGLQRIPGVAATIGRDGSSASLVYDASFGDSYDRETSLMDYLAPGEVFRLGGVDGGIYSSHAGKVDGSEMLGSLLDYSENAPVPRSASAPCSAMPSYASRRLLGPAPWRHLLRALRALLQC